MPEHLQFFRSSIVTKLIMMNVVILLAVGGVVIVNLLFSRQVSDTLTNVIDRDVVRVLENAALSRNLNTVFAETHLLLNTFTERDHVLANEGERLVTIIRSSIAARKSDDDIHTALTQFQHTLEALLEQCAKILRISDQIKATERDLETAIDELDIAVTDLIITRNIEGRAYELFALEQVSASIPDYRSLLLQVAMQLANARHDYPGSNSAEDAYEQRISELLKDLTTGLLSITTAGDELVAPGEHLLTRVSAYQEHITAFHAAMSIFQERFRNLNQAQEQVMMAMTTIEAEIAHATGRIRTTVDRDIRASRNVTAIFSAIIFVALGGVGLYAIRLTQPILHLTTSAVAMAEGNLNTPIETRGTDEVGKLARSFTHMRDAVREKIDALAENNRKLRQEIQERHRIEVALRESEERFRSIFAQSPIAIELYDKHGVLLDVNAKCLELFGLTSIEAVKEFQLFEDPNIPDDDKARLRTGQPVRYEAPFDFDLVKAYNLYDTTKSGQCFLECFITPLGTNSGGNQGFLVHVSDATERRRAEEHIKNQNLLLEQAVQEKQQEMEAMFERLIRQEKLATIGQMAGSIAHELRNPLGAVKNSIFYLKRLYHKQNFDASNPKVEEHLNLIEQELEISERVISDLLQMTRIKAVQRRQTHLRQILAEAAKRCQLPAQIQLNMDLVDDSCLVWADTAQLRQVLMNLLTNAAQAIDREGIITVRAKSVAEEDATLIEVEDNGRGIERDALGKIFDPLYTSKTTGTGLGLSLCKQIIENHQGSITVRSRPGCGTTVTLALPDHIHDV